MAGGSDELDLAPVHCPETRRLQAELFLPRSELPSSFGKARLSSPATETRPRQVPQLN